MTLSSSLQLEGKKVIIEDQSREETAASIRASLSEKKNQVVDPGHL